MDQSVSASHACGHAGSSGVKWPHDTPGAPAAAEKRPYPDGSEYIQPQLAPAGAIDVTSRAAPRPTSGPITQRETQRPADGLPAEYALPVGKEFGRFPGSRGLGRAGPGAPPWGAEDIPDSAGQDRCAGAGRPLGGEG